MTEILNQEGFGKVSGPVARQNTKVSGPVARQNTKGINFKI